MKGGGAFLSGSFSVLEEEDWDRCEIEEEEGKYFSTRSGIIWLAASSFWFLVGGGGGGASEETTTPPPFPENGGGRSLYFSSPSHAFLALGM